VLRGNAKCILSICATFRKAKQGLLIEAGILPLSINIAMIPLWINIAKMLLLINITKTLLSINIAKIPF
jgi:hypothetical protein